MAMRFSSSVKTRGGNQLLHFRLARVGHLHLGAFLDREFQTHAESNEPQQARGVVVKAVGADGAQLVAFDIGQPVHGVEQQAARSLQRLSAMALQVKSRPRRSS
jgi:hypothetical protein